MKTNYFGKFLTLGVIIGLLSFSSCGDKPEEPTSQQNTSNTEMKKGDTTLPTSSAELAELIKFGEKTPLIR